SPVGGGEVPLPAARDPRPPPPPPLRRGPIQVARPQFRRQIYRRRRAFRRDALHGVSPRWFRFRAPRHPGREGKGNESLSTKRSIRSIWRRGRRATQKRAAGRTSTSALRSGFRTNPKRERGIASLTLRVGHRTLETVSNLLDVRQPTLEPPIRHPTPLQKAWPGGERLAGGSLLPARLLPERQQPLDDFIPRRRHDPLEVHVQPGVRVPQERAVCDT